MGRYRNVAALAAMTTLFLALAQDTAVPTLTVVENPEWGSHLADSQGRSLYVYQLDEGGVSACTDEVCTRNWPPYLVEGEVTAGEGVDAALVGTYERPDGTTQVTYNGWPLYYNARDEAQGHVRGQALGDVFFLMAPVGNAVAVRPQPEGSPDPAEAEQEGREQAQEGEGDAAEAGGSAAAGGGEAAGGAEAVGEGQQDGDAATRELMATGQQVFSSICAACHGAEGQGAVGPRLAGNSLVGRDREFLNVILNGRLEHGMPAFRDQLDDQQIAGVATFVRNSFGNSFTPITPEQVAEQR